MKRVILCLITALMLIVAVAGCQDSASIEKLSELTEEVIQLNAEVSRLNDEVDKLEAEKFRLQADLFEAENSEPAEITYFSSSSELEKWLSGKSYLQTTTLSSIEEDYANALKLQQEALTDGFIINVYTNMDEAGDYMWVWCDARTLSGDVYYWGMIDFSDYEWCGNWGSW